jgi:outer membrane protein, heavy metal efflux system
MIKKIIFMALSAWAINTNGQTIEAVLGQIEKNNKTLMAEKQYWESERLSFKTGLNPENPKIDYEHLPGRPEGAGTQKDLSITQSFDFPTSYSKRRRVADEQIEYSSLQYSVFRQEILLEAKLNCLLYIHRKNLQAEYDKRLKDANTLLSAINRRVNQGESNILDLNKVRLLHLDISNESALNASELLKLQNKLEEMNGGATLNLFSLEYTASGELPPFEEMDSLIEANDPVVKAVEQEREINEQQVGATRQLTLPKFEGGFHRQSILGQTYQGFHVGMTIPLWENSNRVKTQKARLLHSEFQIAEHRTEHYFGNKQLYEQYLHWSRTNDRYNEILNSANNDVLLNRAFEAGQISLIEYLMEVRYFYDAISKSLEAERNVHEAIARLHKFQL